MVNIEEVVNWETEGEAGVDDNRADEEENQQQRREKGSNLFPLFR